MIDLRDHEILRGALGVLQDMQVLHHPLTGIVYELNKGGVDKHSPKAEYLFGMATAYEHMEDMTSCCVAMVVAFLLDDNIAKAKERLEQAIRCVRAEIAERVAG